MTGAVRRLPVLDIEPPRRGPDRRVDRRLTYLGLATAIAFLAMAVGSLLLPAGTRLGIWLPLHLALAGGAGTAIAAMVPFFAATLAVAPPASWLLRGGSIGLVAAGAILAAAGRADGVPDLAALGAWLFVAGFAGVALATMWSLRHAGGPRRPLTEAAYLLAVANVLVGVSIAGLLLAGAPDVGSRWAALKPAHGWLNVFGFVCLVIAGTLIHFAPTVAGSRIRRRPSGLLAVAGLAVGAPLVALGYATGGTVVAQLGGLATLAGAAALAVHGWQAHRDRAGWTTERAWHVFTGGSLLLAPVWLVVAATAAVARLVAHGVEAESWRFTELLGPLVLGVIAQVLVGALGFLVPALSPGSPERHAHQRRRLGRFAAARMVALNVGAGLLTVSGFLPDANDPIAAAVLAGGLILALGSLAATLLLLAGALADALADSEDRPSGRRLDPG